MYSGYIIGSASSIATQLRSRLPHTTKVVALEIADPVVWDAVCKDPSMRGPVSPSQVSHAFRARTANGRKDLVVFAFVKSLSLDTVFHFRTRHEMNRITDEAVIKSVMET